MTIDKVTQAERKLADTCSSCGGERAPIPNDLDVVGNFYKKISWAVRLTKGSHKKCFKCWMNED